MKKFTKEIDNTISIEQYNTSEKYNNLPLAHSTSSLKALKILEQGTICAKVDDKIRKEEPHLYFFYGRAAYPVHRGELPRGDYSYFTFCFLVRSESAIINYAFPFDSGAFINGFYSPFFNEDFDLLRFSLPSNLDDINNFIIHIFGNYDNYMRGDLPQKTINIDYSTSFEVCSYWNMVLNKSAQNVDSRCRTVEIVSNSDVKLNNKTLLAIVMPEILRDHKIIKKLLTEIPNLDVITYPCFFGDTDDSYYGVVREKVYVYLRGKSLI